MYSFTEPMIRNSRNGQLTQKKRRENSGSMYSFTEPLIRNSRNGQLTQKKRRDNFGSMYSFTKPLIRNSRNGQLTQKKTKGQFRINVFVYRTTDPKFTEWTTYTKKNEGTISDQCIRLPNH